MKDVFYFTLSLTENEHDIMEGILFEELDKRGYELIYYRQYKTGHVPMMREAKTDAPRWVVLDICMDFGISITAAGFFYKNGIMDGEKYNQGYENLKS